MSIDTPNEDPRLIAWVNVIDYYWQRASLNKADRERLRDELMRDLESSLAGGASVESLTEADPAAFADELARADGAKTKPLRPDPVATKQALVTTMLGGAVAGFIVALALVYPLGIWTMDQTPANDNQQGWIALGLHVVAGALSVAGALAAAWWKFRFQVGTRRTLVMMGASFALGGSVSIAPTVLFARATGYSGEFWVVSLEVAAVVGCCAAGAWLASCLVPSSGSSRRPLAQK